MSRLGFSVSSMQRETGSVTSIMQILKKGIILNSLNKSLKGRKENYTHEKFTKKGEENHLGKIGGISAEEFTGRADKDRCADDDSDCDIGGTEGIFREGLLRETGWTERQQERIKASDGQYWLWRYRA